MHLRLDKGVLLTGSQTFSDYPEIATPIAGIETRWPASLINIIEQKNVMVSGEEKVNAQGKFCRDKYWAMRKDYEAKGLCWIVDYDAKGYRFSGHDVNKKKRCELCISLRNSCYKNF